MSKTKAKAMVRTLALRSINARNMAKSLNNKDSFGWTCKADAYRRAAKFVAVELGLCKAIYA